MTELITTKNAADLMGLTPKTLAEWRCRGNGPRFVKLSASRNGLVRYRRRDIEAWIAAKEFTGTYQYGSQV